MPTTTTVRPGTDLAGTWEQDQPSVFSGANYTEPVILGQSVAAYAGNDQNANAANVALSLPNINQGVGDITPVGAAGYSFVNTFVTSINVPLPGGVQAGDLLELICVTQEDVANAPGAPNQPAGWSTRYSFFQSIGFRPHVTKFYRIADGSEGATVTVSWGQAARVHAATVAWRGVDQSNPYGVTTPLFVGGWSNTTPNPPTIQSEVDGGAVIGLVAGNRPPSGVNSNVSSNQTEVFNNTDIADRGMAFGFHIGAAGTQDPFSYSYPADNWTATTDVLRPAGDSVTAVLVTSANDGTASGQVANPPELASTHEVQVLDQVGTVTSFTLTVNGQTTAALGSTVSATQLVAAMEALPGISAGDVEAVGGPLNVAPITVTFRGALEYQDLPQMTTSASPSNLQITTQSNGKAPVPFTFRGTINVPRTGAARQSQMHVWSAELGADYEVGRSVAFEVADQDPLDSWQAILLVCDELDPADPVSPVGGIAGGTSGQANYGNLTPGRVGSKLVALLGKALVTGAYSGEVPVPSAPVAYSDLANAVGDLATLSAFLSPPVDTTVQSPGPSSWTGGVERWATGMMSLNPANPAVFGGSISAVLEDASGSTWLEFAPVAGRMYEVVELDLSAVPASAVKLGASVRFTHISNARNRLRAVLVGIRADDTIQLGAEQQDGYIPDPVNQTQTVTSQQWTELADGSPIMDWDRLGVALISSDAQPGLSTHKVYDLWVDLEFEEGGPVTQIVPPAVNGDPVAWNFSSTSGYSQTHYEVRVMQGVGDPDTAVAAVDPLLANPGELIYSSGKTAGSSVRSLTVPTLLGRGQMTASVRTWIRFPSGLEVASDWSTAQFDLPGGVPGGPTGPVGTFDAARAAVDIDLTTPAAVSRAWLWRSTDGGATYSQTEESPIDVAASSAITITDAWAPLNNQVRYRLVFDDGVMSETSVPVDVTADLDTSVDTWFLIAPESPGLNVVLDVESFQVTERVRSQRTESTEGAVVVNSLPLGDVLSLRVRTLDKAARDALTAILESGFRLRVVDSLGREWICAPEGDRDHQMMRAAPQPAEITGLRDAHLRTVTLVEVLS